jgi:hypothetical protein
MSRVAALAHDQEPVINGDFEGMTFTDILLAAFAHHSGVGIGQTSVLATLRFRRFDGGDTYFDAFAHARREGLA